MEKLKKLAYKLPLRVIEGRLYLAVRFREEKQLPVQALKQLSRTSTGFALRMRRLRVCEGVAVAVGRDAALTKSRVGRGRYPRPNQKFAESVSQAAG